MASIWFLIVGTKKKKKIYVRLKENAINYDKKASLNLTVLENHWSSSKERVKVMKDNTEYAEKINSTLSKVKTELLQNFNLDYSEGKEIDLAWLKQTILKIIHQPGKDEEDWKYYLSDYTEKFIEEAALSRTNPRTGKRINYRTIQEYKTTLRYLKELEENVTNQRIRLNNVTLDFKVKFDHYLSEVWKLSDSTVAGHINNLKLFCRQAKKRGLNVSNDVEDKDFTKPKSKSLDIYLTEEEITRIYEYKFKNEKLDNARDWFIIGLWSGLRVSDLLKLDVKKHIEEKEFIVKENYKTGILTVIPLHQQAVTTLEKRNWQFPRKISDQKFNDYIKEVCKRVGLTEEIEGSLKKNVEINDPLNAGKTIKRQRIVDGIYPKYKLVSSHICRRSFATNHYGEIDTATLMQITGHTTEKQFLSYIKKSPRDHADKLKEIWKRKYITQGS